MLQSALMGNLLSSSVEAVPVWLASYSPSSSSVDITDVMDGTYAHYLILASGVIGTDDGMLSLRVSTDNGSTWDSGASDYGSTRVGLRSNTSLARESVGASVLRLAMNAAGQGIGSAAGEGFAARIWMHSPHDSNPTYVAFHNAYINPSSVASVIWGAGRRVAAQNDNAVQLLGDGGITGNVSIYGVDYA